MTEPTALPPTEDGPMPPALPAVEEGAAGPPPTPPARVFPVRWAIAGVVTVGVAAVAVAVWLLFGQPRAETAAGAWLPADTVGYLEVSTDLGAGQRERVLGLLKRFPGFEDQARLGDKIDETLARVLGRADIDYRAQVKPWLGDSVAVGFRVPAGGAPAPTDGMSVPVVVLLASTNDDAAGAFVGTLAERATTEGGSVATGAYRDVTVTTVTRAGRSDSTRPQAVAVVNGRLVVGDPDLIRAVIDVRRAGTAALDSNGSFHSAMAGLPSDRVGALWVDAEGILAAGRRDLGASGLAGSALGMLHFSPGSALVGFARAEEDGLLVEVTGRGSISGAALLQPSPGSGSPHTSTLVGSAPRHAAVFFEVHDVGAAIATALAAARLQDPSAADSLRQLDQALTALGTSADEVAAAIGDAAVVVTMGGRARVAIVVHMNHPALASRLINQVDALLGLSGLGRVTTRDYEGTVLHQLEATSVTLPGGNAAPTYALVGDSLVIGLDEDIVISIIDARSGGSGLGGDPDYQSLTGRVGAENNGALYVNIGRLVGALPGAGMDAETRAFVEPLRAAGWAIRSAGESEWLGTSRFFLLIR